MNSRRRTAACVCLAWAALLTPSTWGQTGAGHYPLSDWIPPGAAGSWWTTAEPANQYYPQPVRVEAPEGVIVSIAVAGGFDGGEPAPRSAQFAVGATYRLQLAAIPRREEALLFPTIEVLDRLHPPAGRAAEFPIPVVITRDDLESALAGDYVVKVIYVEAPEVAEAIDHPEQPLRETAADEDALELADVLGRPVAILRMGGRRSAPSNEFGMATFAFGYPEWRPIAPALPTEAPRPAADDSIAQRFVGRPVGWFGGRPR